jgi:hypothetical protein
VHGQSADLRVTRNMWREATIICREHGRPDGFRGQVYRAGARLKRQWQKLTRRGHLDLLPGSWILRLRREMKTQTEFTSNIDMTKYKDT